MNPKLITGVLDEYPRWKAAAALYYYVNNVMGVPREYTGVITTCIRKIHTSFERRLMPGFVCENGPIRGW